MEFDRRIDRTGALCRIVRVTNPPAGTLHTELAAAARNLQESAMAARELPARAGRDEKLLVLDWALRAVEELNQAIQRSLAAGEADAVRLAA